MAVIVPLYPSPMDPHSKEHDLKENSLSRRLGFDTGSIVTCIIIVVEIRWDLVDIWPDLFEICWDLIEIRWDLVEICPDLFKIWSDPTKKQQISVDFCKFQRRFEHFDANRDLTRNWWHPTTRTTAFGGSAAGPSIRDPKWSSWFRVRHKPD